MPLLKRWHGEMHVGYVSVIKGYFDMGKRRRHIEYHVEFLRRQPTTKLSSVNFSQHRANPVEIENYQEAFRIVPG
jgi:hypothetical protein